jgi:hypothetical protein
MDGTNEIEEKMEVEYHSESGKISLNLLDNDATFQSEVEEIDINPQLVDIRSLEINRQGASVKFESPLIMKKDGDSIETKLIGFKLNGINPAEYFKDADVFQTHMFSEDWFKSVEKQRKRIEERRKRINGNGMLW